MIIVRLLVLFGLYISPAWSLAATYTAASCSTANVQTAIGFSTDGDTVEIPSCSVTDWTTHVTINEKSITIKGAGIGNTTIRQAGSGEYSFYVPATNTKRVTFSDMTLQMSTDASNSGPPFYEAGGIRVDGGSFIVARIRFDYVSVGGVSYRGIETNGVSTGLIHACIFRDVYAGVFIFGTGNTTWATDTGLGDANSIYYEDNNCTFSSNIYGACLESGDGGSYVARHSIFPNGEIGQHGACESGTRGHRRSEIYHNTFTAGTGHAYNAISIMGGTGVIFSNVITGYESPVHFNYKRACDSDECASPYDTPCDGDAAIDGNQLPSGWRCLDQLGTGKNQAAEPMYAWNNCDQSYSCWDGSVCTCGGSGHVVRLVYNASSSCVSTLTGLIAEDRDYYNQTILSGYVPYAYPHPLRGEPTGPFTGSMQ